MGGIKDICPEFDSASPDFIHPHKPESYKGPGLFIVFPNSPRFGKLLCSQGAVTVNSHAR